MIPPRAARTLSHSGDPHKFALLRDVAEADGGEDGDGE
jgi:hypothetical protein